ncbi:MAG: TadE/TadG family type IV pilus assembly protein [Desulfovibrionaceae bacterium]
MRKNKNKQRGLAAIEFAITLPVLTLLLLMIVEGSNAMRVYTVLQDASREGARLVLREGDMGQVPAVVESITAQLPETTLGTTVTTDVGGDAVTVEVTYVYESMLGLESALEALSGGDSYVLKAQTTMPLP